MTLSKKQTPVTRKTASPKASAGANEAADVAREVLWERPGFLVRRLNQIHYAMFFEECHAHNITPVQYGILTALSLVPWMDQTEIGMDVGLDRTTTADVVKRLQERGLIERRTNPEDKRSRQAKLTKEGARVVEELHAGMARAQERLLEPLNARSREVFMRLLATLVEGNNQYGRTVLRGF
ncbi:MarR family winged helix-turn-helix transcriptional regulator [Bordetella genomosp. 4]|uniref:MarR family transcriptional regulator n=1 Tax=Bordetella genomosp. 4 TaxID=463044 RepID=A0A261U5C3_9BORD|nr:MarR family transcriptional regulator [Bordetella genomosp. 4]OZI56053.1 MarR family transcriptional regulator [Bordetella genomosp. 4]